MQICVFPDFFWRIRKYRSQESTRTLVHSFITGRIDYINSLLFGLPSVHQRLQNATARLISNVPRYSHITPVSYSLHWLPVKYRIDFKILLLTFKAIYGHAPGYLIDLLAIKALKYSRAIISVQLHSFFYIRMLSFRPRLNILIFLPILS